jgi:hypothetical protein
LTANGKAMHSTSTRRISPRREELASRSIQQPLRAATTETLIGLLAASGLWVGDGKAAAIERC